MLRGPIGLVFVVAVLSVAMQQQPGSAAPGSGADDARPIRLRARTFVPERNVERGLRRSFEMRVESTAPRHLLIQFGGPITKDTVAALAAQGATALRVVPDNALAIAAPSFFDAAAVPGARWTGELQPDDKISADTREDLSSRAPAHPFTMIEFYSDTLADVSSDAILGAGAIPIEVPGLPPYVRVVRTHAGVVRALSQLDAVAWIYPAGREITSGEPVYLCDGLADGAGIVASFATEGDGWDGPGLNPARLGFFFQKASTDLPAARQAAEIGRAMSEWSRYVVLEWVQGADPYAQRSVNILWGPTHHGDAYPFPPNVLAHTFFPPPPGWEPAAGDVHFNDGFKWGAAEPGTYDVFSVALHELGHALGLNHASSPDAVMYPSYQGMLTGLAARDVATVRTLYRPRPAPALPEGWHADDVGKVGVEGTVVATSTSLVLTASGADVWDRADAFTFASRRLTGDGDIVARVDSLRWAHRWSKAGVMIRAGRDASAAHAFMFVSGAQGLAFQRRRTANGWSLSTSGALQEAPAWVRLSRRGDRFTAYASADGLTWTPVGTDTIAMGATVDAGVALTSHADGLVATAEFSNIAVTPLAEWNAADIGAVRLTGGATWGPDRVNVLGAGHDIWGVADAFHFAWRVLWGDGEIVARVARLDARHAWTKAGVMVRASRDAAAPHAFMLVSGSRGAAFQRRAGFGLASLHTSGAILRAPAWVRLVRQGDLFSAYTSSDGRTWRLVGVDRIAMGEQVMAGLAVSSHVATATSSALFDRVRITSYPESSRPASQSSTR